MESAGAVVTRGFGLTEQLKALRVNQICTIFFKDYSLSVVYSTIARLNRRGPFRFQTRRKKKKREELDRVIVKRIV